VVFSGGEYLAAWKLIPFRDADGGIFGTRISTAGTVISPGSSGIRVSQPSASFYYPALAANPSGGLLVWLDQYNQSGIHEVKGAFIHPFGR
jgi:hypothetical protein